MSDAGVETPPPAAYSGRISRRTLAASFAEVRPMEWMFVGFGWLTLAYFAFIATEQLRPDAISPETGQAYERWDFDILPVFAGVCVVVFGWRALRLGDSVAHAISELDQESGLLEQGDVSVEAFKDDFKKTVRHRQYAGAVAVALLLMTGYGAALWGGNLSLGSGPVGTGFAILLGAVMFVSGCSVGYLLGRLWGHGRLPAVLSNHRIAFSGLASAKAQAAMAALEDVYIYAELATMVTCHWFALWWIIWSLGFDPMGYKQWLYMFLAAWLLGLGFFQLGARGPAIALRKSRDATGATVEEQNNLRLRQIAEAEEDCAKLEGKPQPLSAADRRDLNDLEAYIGQLRAIRAGRRSLDKWFLDALLIENLALFFIPLAYGWLTGMLFTPLT